MIINLKLKDFKSVMINRGYDRHFTEDGLEALFDFYSNLEDEKEETINIDDIDFAGEWTQYATLEKALDDYHLDYQYQLEDLTDVIEVLDDECGVMVRDI